MLSFKHKKSLSLQSDSIPMQRNNSQIDSRSTRNASSLLPEILSTSCETSVRFENQTSLMEKQ